MNLELQTKLFISAANAHRWKMVDVAEFLTTSALSRRAMFAGWLSVVADTIPDDGEGWLREGRRIGDSQYALSDSSPKEGKFEPGQPSNLTALQAATCLMSPNDPRQTEIAVKMRTRHFIRQGNPPGEVVDVACFDDKSLRAHFLPCYRAAEPTPTVICIGDEQEPMDILLGRLLPAAANKGMSLLLVEMSDIQDHPPGKKFETGTITSELRLSCCVDYLVSRADVDAGRVAVHGNGLAASYATRLAIYDDRIAAAVCDGGLWESIRTRTAIDWMSGVHEPICDQGAPTVRSRSARRIACPFLMVANERSVGSVTEAIALHADCRSLGVSIDLYVPPVIQTPSDIVGNFNGTNEPEFSWLAVKLLVASDRLVKHQQQAAGRPARRSF